MFNVREKLELDYTETTERISTEFRWRMGLGLDFRRYYTSGLYFCSHCRHLQQLQIWCPQMCTTVFVFLEFCFIEQQFTLLIHSVPLTSLTLLSQIEDTCFSLTFFGEGYSESTDPSQGRPNAKICTQVIGAGKSACRVYTSVYSWAYLQQQHV